MTTSAQLWLGMNKIQFISGNECDKEKGAKEPIAKQTQVRKLTSVNEMEIKHEGKK
jgi:hypothetical protein